MKEKGLTGCSRIFILALDGLEYNLVKRYRLHNIMQKFHGYIDVSNFEHILTPIIWASFITGKLPDEHKIYSWWRFSKYKLVDKFIHWMRYNFPIIRNMSSTKLKHLFGMFGLKVRPTMKMDLNYKTIFDYAAKPIALFVPSYNEEPWIRDRYSAAFDLGCTEFEKVLWEIHHYRKRKVMSKLNNDWDLFMAWFDLADWMGHLYMGYSNLKILKTYIELDRLARALIAHTSNDTLFMIVSDHGMKPGGEHSNRAFFSFNKEISWRPSKITDYYHLVINTLSKERSQIT